jgi:hypothetical protein
MKKNFKRLYKKNEKEVMDAMDNNERPNKVLISTIKKPIREKIENLESP